MQRRHGLQCTSGRGQAVSKSHITLLRCPRCRLVKQPDEELPDKHLRGFSVPAVAALVVRFPLKHTQRVESAISTVSVYSLFPSRQSAVLIM